MSSRSLMQSTSASALPVPGPEPNAASPPGQPPGGASALLAAATAMLGVATALFPHAPIVEALTTALPQLRVALPVVLTAVGSVWAALAHPPAFGRRERLLLPVRNKS